MIDVQSDPKLQIVIFAAVMRDVEFLHSLLQQAGFKATYVYSSLDPVARKTNTEAFREGRCQLLVVTDLAARGIDIPHLSAVINFNFPAKPKLFVHRVGASARVFAVMNAIPDYFGLSCFDFRSSGPCWDVRNGLQLALHRRSALPPRSSPFPRPQSKCCLIRHHG